MGIRSIGKKFSIGARFINWVCQTCTSLRLVATKKSALLTCLSAAIVISGCSAGGPVLFSSAISPNGIWIAENFGYDGCCGGGVVRIHKTSERFFLSDGPVTSSSPTPDLFMIWQDDDHLSLVRDSHSEPLIGLGSFRGLTILYSQYQGGAYDEKTYDSANHFEKINIEKEKVSAEIATETTKTGRRCVFSVSAIDGTVYDKIGMKIEASANRCNRQSNCAGILSHFWVGKRIDGRHDVALTSATVADVISYNRLPDGDRNGVVRGSFGEDSAVDLMRQLNFDAWEIKYSLNFFDAVLSYHLDTKQILNSVDKFRACVGDADFNWVRHGEFR